MALLSAVNSRSIEIKTEYVLYKESEKLCDEDKFSLRFVLDVNELIQRIDQLHLQLSNQTFWIPNVKLTENSGNSLVEIHNLFKALKNCIFFLILFHLIDFQEIKVNNHHYVFPDTLCTFVTTRDNSLDTFTGNCSIHQLGICINNSCK